MIRILSVFIHFVQKEIGPTRRKYAFLWVNFFIVVLFLAKGTEIQPVRTSKQLTVSRDFPVV